VGFGALNSGNNLLYLVFSLMLAFLVLSGVLSESALRHLELRRRIPREIFAGAPATFAVEITNASRTVPAFAIVVEDLLQPVEDVESYRPFGRSFVLRVAPASTEHRAYRFVAEKRGEARLAGYRVSTRFPFGLFAKAAILDLPASVLVFPTLVPVPADPRTGTIEGREPVGRARPESGAEVVGLRAYAPGDSPRRIHWPATLRRGSRVVRQSEEPRASEASVYLATRGPIEGPRFEQNVRRAASEAVSLLAEGARVSLRTDSTWIAAAQGSAQRLRLLDFLARVTPEAG
jgi:uncharacterized protein (DUF58 family)